MLLFSTRDRLHLTQTLSPGSSLIALIQYKRQVASYTDTVTWLLPHCSYTVQETGCILHRHCHLAPPSLLLYSTRDRLHLTQTLSPGSSLSAFIQYKRQVASCTDTVTWLLPYCSYTVHETGCILHRHCHLAPPSVLLYSTRDRLHLTQTLSPGSSLSAFIQYKRQVASCTDTVTWLLPQCFYTVQETGCILHRHCHLAPPSVLLYSTRDRLHLTQTLSPGSSLSAFIHYKRQVASYTDTVTWLLPQCSYSVQETGCILLLSK